jgi:hypothetical protein
VLGWCTDFLRLVWGLFYWNTRKSWFRLRRGRSRCPCQNPSDSGRAFETGCEACVQWANPARFRRVCPLLVDTKDGLRCSAHTADVRPFWGRAFKLYGAGLLAVYLAGCFTIFAILRWVGYPISIVHLTLPPLWHRVPEVRSSFFLNKSNLAFDQGRTPEGLLYLANAYEFDPNNYLAGISLAKRLQVGRPAHSDEVFQKLFDDHPDKRHATAQDWYRALLARGSFPRITTLARDELLADAKFAPVWIRALLFASRQVPDDKVVPALIANPAPAAQIWRQLLETEVLLRAGRFKEARALLDRPWPKRAPAFTLFFRVNALIEVRDSLAAIDLLKKHPGVLDQEAAVTLYLDALAAAGYRTQLRAEVSRLLSPRLTLANLAVVKVLCAHLTRYPDTALFERLAVAFERDPIPLNTDTAGIWFSMLTTAGSVGDRARLHEFTARLKNSSSHPFVALSFVEAFFRGETTDRRIHAFLPILPLPLEVTYALIERYPLPAVTAAPARPQP